MKGIDNMMVLISSVLITFQALAVLSEIKNLPLTYEQTKEKIDSEIQMVGVVNDKSKLFLSDIATIVICYLPLTILHIIAPNLITFVIVMLGTFTLLLDIPSSNRILKGEPHSNDYFSLWLSSKLVIILATVNIVLFVVYLVQGVLY